MVNDILNEIIANDGALKISNNKKDKFYIDSNTLKRYRFIEGDAPVSKIVAGINELIHLNTMKRLKSTDITKWFISIGILNEFKSYYIVMYPKNIQEFIIDNFDNLLEFINNN